MDNNRVLIVDDDYGICETLRDILELRKFSCEIASSGADALKKVKAECFDVVFCDLRLPDIIGTELMEKVREAGCTAVYFMITGDGDVQSAIDALKRGAADYFIKPLNIDKLLHGVDAALEMKSTKKSLLVSQEQLTANYETQKVANSLLQLAMSNNSLDDVLQNAVDLMVNMSWVSAEGKGAIFLVDGAKENLLLKAHSGFYQAQLERCEIVPFGKCVCGKVALGKKVQFGSCYGHCLKQKKEHRREHNQFCVPIIINDEVEGVINLIVRHQWQATDLDFLSGIANTIASIIQKKRITQLNDELERQVQQSQRLEAMGTLAGGIAHDFNNILTAIIGFSDIALGMLEKESQPYHFVKQVFVSGERARDLVKQILSFSRKDAIKKQPLILTPIVKEVAKLLRASFPANISIDLKFDPQLKSVMADPTQIHQVLMNLCINAFHALQRSGGAVKIILQNITLPIEKNNSLLHLPSGEYIALIVSDDGSGIDQENLNRIFDPYFTTKEKGKGTGLGLSVVHGIVKGHDGDIAVQSEVGAGTVFTVLIPVVESLSGGSVYTDVGADMPHGTESILLVDDEEKVVFVTKHLLDSLGYKVFSRTSSLEALQAFKHDPWKYDLVISDIAMPKLSGDVLCAKLIALRADIPVILCTGFSELIDNEKAKQIGARKLLHKPIVKQQLAQVVRDVLDGE